MTVSVGTIQDILSSHTPEWDYDKSYDEPVRCSCGWENDEEPIELHVATIVYSMVRPEPGSTGTHYVNTYGDLAPTELYVNDCEDDGTGHCEVCHEAIPTAVQS